MSRPTLFRSEDRRITAAEDRLILSLYLLIGASQRAGWRTDRDTHSIVAAAWSLAHGYCALRVRGSLDRQFFPTPTPTPEQLAAAVGGHGDRCTLASCGSHGGESC